MPDRIARLSCVLLLAVLAGAPAVRTLCAWECGAAGLASVPAEDGHCARTAETSGGEAAALVSAAGCARCDILGEGLRATVRTAATALEPTSTVPVRAATADVLTPFGRIVAMPATAAAPPLRAPYPLRI